MDAIRDICKAIRPVIVDFRRDVHKHPEGPLAEYRTASAVIRHLQKLGYEVYFGDDANDLTNIVDTLPSQEDSERECQRAIRDGADPEHVKQMKYGKTGVMGVLRCGEGPVVGIRCDMDAVYLGECEFDDHIPYREGFRSIYEGISHGCNHDAHTAIGIGIAEVMVRLKNEGKLTGTLKLFFQPAEEIFAGGRSMVDKGVADDLTHSFTIHMGVSTTRTGQIAALVVDFPKIVKYDVKFFGQNGHADCTPEQGKNALLAACTATIGLNAICRHSKGNSRVNVGLIKSGSPLNLNAIPGYGEIVLELVAFCDEVFDFLYESSVRVINGAAAMYDCTAQIDLNKSAVPVESAKCDYGMIDFVRRAAEKVPEIDEFFETGSLHGAGEDASLYIKKAQKNGGMGTYIMFGSDLSNNLHTPFNDVCERSLIIATETMSHLIADIMSK